MIACRVNFDMSRQLCLIHSGCNGCYNHGRTVFISYVILNHQNRPDAALLWADDRSQICIKNISSANYQNTHTPFWSLSESSVIFMSFRNMTVPKFLRWLEYFPVWPELCNVFIVSYSFYYMWKISFGYTGIPWR